MYCSICEFNCSSNLSASKVLPAFTCAILFVSVVLNWDIASSLCALLWLTVFAKPDINWFVWFVLVALNCAAALLAAWLDNIDCCLFCALRTATCWLLLKLLISIPRNACAFKTCACWLLFKLAISSEANLAALDNVACCALLKFATSNVLNKFELDITVCCALFKFNTSIPAIVLALAKDTAWLLFIPAIVTCCCNCAFVKAVDCKFAKFCNLTCCCWLAVVNTACCAFCKLANPICCSKPASVKLAFIAFSAFFISAWNCCCLVKTSACCWLVKLAIAVCCNIEELACAIGIADCIIELINASLPTEERLIPLCANWASTASTALLAHAGIVPVSIPCIKVCNCADTKVVVGKAATCACTAVGWLIITLVTWAGLLPTAAWILPGSCAVCAFTVAAVPLIAVANAPVDNVPCAACAIAWVVGVAVWPATVAPEDNVPCAEVTCDEVPTVPCAAVPVCAVPCTPVIWPAVKFVGCPIVVADAGVAPVMVGAVKLAWPTVVGEPKVEPLNNSLDWTVWFVYVCFAASAISGFSIWSDKYLSMSWFLLPISVACPGVAAVGIFSNFLVAIIYLFHFLLSNLPSTLPLLWLLQCLVAFDLCYLL